MSRISATFARLKAQQKKALIPFITAGDPTPDSTVPLMHALVAAGADVIELGVPFSDPMADGPVIQRASERALKHGVSLRSILTWVAQFRAKDTSTPVVLMGYANPIEQMGYAGFAQAAAQAGVDGVLVVDLPPEEAHGWPDILRHAGLDPVYLLSPTSSAQRVELVARAARGYIYYVSLKGVTGAANIDLSDVTQNIAKIRALTDIPIGVGFGIRDGATAQAVARVADAVVVGSRIVQEIERSSPQDVTNNVGALVREVRAAMDVA